ncbi:glycoside hydrolase family 76 protein [Thermothelomyces thermophilus ATCC 42464]|uniref:Mannan endo-1,6-alpha-mannosidase n=1 Tax=Thermothelomyces thermophilus (strain ATCC 42464 / BCRC 31852 / DSM 1799) TaxID=573729 RepID=G2QB99_THET4|nr:glycoside hydrolase family 76 protein [Thermothelomyces thermophilus ATCC 42464]AEO56838.1 glycoside hydrolase family 76 protein [Thermothelomyces thermophilus ATCC 42464]
MRISGILASLCVLARCGTAIDLVLGDEDSVKSAASTIAFGLVKYYTGNNTGDTPGNLPDPYFWWEAGAMFGTLVDYWALTGDDSYNAITTQAILHQATEKGDFMPPNQTRTLGNDDQGFWGMAAMSAAENNFPNPPEDQPQWLALAQSLFNQYASRWEEATCGGGLRWQIFTFNNGFNYKNSISNGCFFNIAARLARYTGNETYAEWAEKIFAWEESVGLIDANLTVRDGVHVSLEDGSCNSRDENQWTYNAGIFLHGAAVMYNHTNASAIWRERVDGLLASTTATFVDPATGVLVEQLCEPSGFCNTDQRSFKGYLTRWLAGTAQMAPHTLDAVRPLLEADAAAAARACTGDPAPPVFRGHPGTACGFRWTTGAFDGSAGVGEQMNALSAVMYPLVVRGAAAPPLTADTGGTSKGNPGGGAAPAHEEVGIGYAEITLQDRVAAGFVTSALALGVVAGSAFVIL